MPGRTAVRLQEWLAGKYRARLLLEGDRDKGEKLESLTADFRREFCSSLLVASCKGLADMLLAAGMLFVNKRANLGSNAGGSNARASSSSPPIPGVPAHSSSSEDENTSDPENTEPEDNDAWSPGFSLADQPDCKSWHLTKQHHQMLT